MSKLLQWRFISVGAALALSVAGCSSSNPDPQPDTKLVREYREGGGQTAAAGNAAASTGEGWGHLKGRFVFNGTPPSLTPLNTGGKDPVACEVIKPMPNQNLVVNGSDKAIQYVLVYARKAPRVIEQKEIGEIGSQIFDQKNCIFLSHVLGVRIGHPITVKNSDPVAHNTNCSPPIDRNFNQLIGPGAEFQHTFGRAQSSPVPVSCSIHAWMSAYILPRDDPYYGVSKEDGTFEIKNLPAGVPLEFQVWHESAAGTGNGLQAKPDWGRGRFSVTIPKDDTLDLGTIAAPASAFKF